jgi:hypothetical protein
MAVVARFVIVLCAVACVGCLGRAGRAAEYEPGTPLSTIVSQIGQPDGDRPFSGAYAGLCPAETVRLVDYFGPPAMRFFGDPATTLCIDKSNRVLKALQSIS